MGRGSNIVIVVTTVLLGMCWEQAELKRGHRFDSGPGTPRLADSLDLRPTVPAIPPPRMVHRATPSHERIDTSTSSTILAWPTTKN